MNNNSVTPLITEDEWHWPGVTNKLAPRSSRWMAANRRVST